MEKEYKNEYAVIAIYTMYSCTERGRKIPEDDAASTINICSVSSPKYNWIPDIRMTRLKYRVYSAVLKRAEPQAGSLK